MRMVRRIRPGLGDVSDDFSIDTVPLPPDIPDQSPPFDITNVLAPYMPPPVVDAGPVAVIPGITTGTLLTDPAGNPLIYNVLHDTYGTPAATTPPSFWNTLLNVASSAIRQATAPKTATGLRPGVPVRQVGPTAGASIFGGSSSLWLAAAAVVGIAYVTNQRGGRRSRRRRR